MYHMIDDYDDIMYHLISYVSDDDIMYYLISYLSDENMSCIIRYHIYVGDYDVIMNHLISHVSDDEYYGSYGIIYVM